MAIDLESIADRAQRQLDGMTINREAFARDVLQLVQAIKNRRQQAASKQDPADPPQHQGGFAEAFDDVFGRIFSQKGCGHG